MATPRRSGTTTRKTRPIQRKEVSWATVSDGRNVLPVSMRSAIRSTPTTRTPMAASNETPTYSRPTRVWSAEVSQPATLTGASAAAEGAPTAAATSSGLVSVIVMRYLSRMAPAARSRRPDPMSGGTLPTALDRARNPRPSPPAPSPSPAGAHQDVERHGAEEDGHVGDREGEDLHRPAGRGLPQEAEATADEEGAEHDGRHRVDPAQAGHGDEHERARPQRDGVAEHPATDARPARPPPGAWARSAAR